MRRLRRLPFGIDIDRHRPSPGTQYNLARRRGRTARDSHALAGQGQHQSQRKAGDQTYHVIAICTSPLRQVRGANNEKPRADCRTGFSKSPTVTNGLRQRFGRY